jgi:hypothetical protein
MVDNFIEMLLGEYHLKYVRTAMQIIAINMGMYYIYNEIALSLQHYTGTNNHNNNSNIIYV